MVSQLPFSQPDAPVFWFFTSEFFMSSFQAFHFGPDGPSYWKSARLA
jgi:hypothetical protein